MCSRPWTLTYVLATEALPCRVSSGWTNEVSRQPLNKSQTGSSIKSTSVPKFRMAIVGPTADAPLCASTVTRCGAHMPRQPPSAEHSSTAPSHNAQSSSQQQRMQAAGGGQALCIDLLVKSSCLCTTCCSMNSVFYGEQCFLQ